MSIKVLSRYASATVDILTFVPDGDGILVLFYEFPALSNLTYKEHSYQTGERLDNLALRYYRNPELWWQIAWANPEVEDIQNIPNGTILRIPSV